MIINFCSSKDSIVITILDNDVELLTTHSMRDFSLLHIIVICFVYTLYVHSFHGYAGAHECFYFQGRFYLHGWMNRNTFKRNIEAILYWLSCQDFFLPTLYIYQRKILEKERERNNSPTKRNRDNSLNYNHIIISVDIIVIPIQP